MSADLAKLIESGSLFMGIWDTVWMTLLSSLIGYVVGLPLGVLLYSTDKSGLKPIPWLNKILGFIVNIFRSMPFIILMVAMLPVARFIVGTGIGNKAMVVMLVIASAPYISRMVESSLKEIDGGVIEAARSMGASDLEIIVKVLLPEAKPSLVIGAVISTVTVLGYAAMAATIGGTGLGQIAIVYGHNRHNEDIIWICVLLTLIIVQVIQEAGMTYAKKTDKRIAQRK
ncbi:MAG: ABC transporter permease [Clostridia bacterium]|nr:ABC transporter permease [Clostridia bacterium]